LIPARATAAGNCAAAACNNQHIGGKTARTNQRPACREFGDRIATGCRLRSACASKRRRAQATLSDCTELAESGPEPANPERMGGAYSADERYDRDDHFHGLEITEILNPGETPKYSGVSAGTSFVLVVAVGAVPNWTEHCVSQIRRTYCVDPLKEFDEATPPL
jgi:hypothetical protein